LRFVLQDPPPLNRITPRAQALREMLERELTVPAGGDNEALYREQERGLNLHLPAEKPRSQLVAVTPAEARAEEHMMMMSPGERRLVLDALRNYRKALPNKLPRVPVSAAEARAEAIRIPELKLLPVNERRLVMQASREYALQHNSSFAGVFQHPTAMRSRL
jgi:hypothetical protein